MFWLEIGSYGTKRANIIDIKHRINTLTTSYQSRYILYLKQVAICQLTRQDWSTYTS